MSFFYNRTYLLLYYGKKKRGLIHHTVDEGPRKTRKQEMEITVHAIYA